MEQELQRWRRVFADGIRLSFVLARFRRPLGLDRTGIFLQNCRFALIERADLAAARSRRREVASMAPNVDAAAMETR